MSPAILPALSALVLAAGTSVAQDSGPECGGYRPEALRGFLAGRAPEWLDSLDRRALCLSGTHLNKAVTATRMSRLRADTIWEALVVDYAVCRGPVVEEHVETEMQTWSGQSLAVARTYCSDVWDVLKGGIRANLVSRTHWLRQELFCEFARLERGGMAAFLVPFVREPPSMAATKALGLSLCNDVRARTIPIDDAASRLFRELDRAQAAAPGEIVKETASSAGRSLAWSLKILVAAIGVLGTIIGILIGLRRLTGAPD